MKNMKKTTIELTAEDIKDLLIEKYKTNDIHFNTKVITVKRGYDENGPLYESETIFNGATIKIEYDNTFYVFDNIAKMYFGGVSGWGHIEWVNNLDDAFLNDEKTTIESLDFLKNNDNDLTIGEVFPK